MHSKKIRIYFPILMILLLVAIIVTTAFHHHSDSLDHPGCAICKVCKDLTANDTHLVFHLPHPFIVEVRIKTVIAYNYQSPCVIPKNSRVLPVNSPLS